MQVIKEASHYSMKIVVECDLSYNGRNETENKLSSDILIRWLLVHYFKIELEFEKLFLVDGKKKPQTHRKKKPSRNRRKINQLQTRPKCDTKFTNRNQETAMEVSYHTTMPSLLPEEESFCIFRNNNLK